MNEQKTWNINELPEFEKKDSYESVFLNKYGYYELKKKNTKEERDANFEEHYFQDGSVANYERDVYPPDELKYLRHKIEEKRYVLEQNLEKLGRSGDYSIIDIGCGEGFLIKYFHERGKRVKGVDIGSYALEHFHPELLPFFEKGDMETVLPGIAARGETFDVVNMDRVLDMVDNVEVCLNRVKEIMKPDSLLLVKVANNYSNLQRMLLEKGILKEEYWLDDPGHPSYFNREGLIACLEANGFACMDFYADTFVDFQLANPFSNYYEKPETGKAAHKTTVCLESLFHEISPERTIEIFRMLGDMGFGREIVGIFRKK